MDNLKFFLGIGVAIVIIFAGSSVYTSLQKNAAAAHADRETLYQVSTIDALMQGSYEGTQQVSEIRKRGDFGIGTFDALDGEMIVLDGTVYQAKADGNIYPVQDTATTPLATVTWFDRDMAVKTDRQMNSTEYSDFVVSRLPSRNMIYAVKVHGTFPSMKVRAIPPQQKPYPDLTEAAAGQSVHEYRNITGTIVGFYTPVFFKGLNVAGFHLHFIDGTRSTGGHVLDFTISPGTETELDSTAGFTMTLPTSGSFTNADLSQDLSGALAKIEK
jgi:acetolactate decarboxylase